MLRRCRRRLTGIGYLDAPDVSRSLSHEEDAPAFFGWNEEMKAAAAWPEPLQGMDLR